MTYFRDEISAYVPTAADLDYPKKVWVWECYFELNTFGSLFSLSS